MKLAIWSRNVSLKHRREKKKGGGGNEKSRNARQVTSPGLWDRESQALNVQALFEEEANVGDIAEVEKKKPSATTQSKAIRE